MLLLTAYRISLGGEAVHVPSTQLFVGGDAGVFAMIPRGDSPVGITHNCQRKRAGIAVVVAAEYSVVGL